VTPPGEIYVTEQLASALFLTGGGWRCDYVGIQPAAKGFGNSAVSIKPRGEPLVAADYCQFCQLLSWPARNC